MFYAFPYMQHKNVPSGKGRKRKEWCAMNYVTAENRRGESGNVLIITLMILFAISTIGMTIASVSTMDLKISGNQRVSTQALFAAEAGLNEAIHRLTIADPTTVTVGGWTGNAAISDSEPYDPNWTVLLYLDSPASVSAGSGSIHTTGTIQDLTGDFIEYSAPSGTEGVLTIRHKWIDRNGDGSRDQNEIVRYDPNAVPPENFASGRPVEVVTVTGRSASGERVIQAEVTKKTVSVRTLGALYVDKAVRLTGNCAFCGYDHPYDTPEGTNPDKNGCNPYHNSGGHLPGVTSTGDQVKTQGSAEVKGDPMPINDDATNPFYSLNEVLGLPMNEVQRMLSKADHNSIENPLNGITYIDGDANISSNISGEGLLYITGDLHAAGSFIFKGLIYVEGDVHMTGTPWILGSMVVRGTGDYNFSAGNSAVLYSSETLSRVLENAMPGMVLSWREM